MFDGLILYQFKTLDKKTDFLTTFDEKSAIHNAKFELCCLQVGKVC